MPQTDSRSTSKLTGRATPFGRDIDEISRLAAMRPTAVPRPGAPVPAPGHGLLVRGARTPIEVARFGVEHGEANANAGSPSAVVVRHMFQDASHHLLTSSGLIGGSDLTTQGLERGEPLVGSTECFCERQVFCQGAVEIAPHEAGAAAKFVRRQVRWIALQYPVDPSQRVLVAALIPERDGSMQASYH